MLRLCALLALYGFFAGLGATYYILAEFAHDLPDDLTALKEPPSTASRVYSADGELIGEFFLERRVVVPIEQIPEHVRQAFVSAEDGRFWEHPGFDPIGIFRAAISNLKAGHTTQGASTITQQVARNVVLGPEARRRRTYARKIKEIILSVRIEHELSKRDILEMYLNRVYLGHGAHGVQAAATTYFGKDVGQLSVAEGALLAGLVQRPTVYSPFRNLDLARGRQRYVLSRMNADGYISDAQRTAALREPLALVESDVSLNHVAAPYFVEHVRRWAQKRYGAQSLFYGGLNIFTTLDMRMQRSAEAAVRDGLEDLDRRIGFRGPIGTLDAGKLATFRAAPARPYLPGLETANLGSGATLLPEVAYVGAVTDLAGSSRVTVAVGDRTLPMESRDARRLRHWRGDRKKIGKHRRGPRRRLQVGDLLPVKLGEGRRGQPVFILAQEPDVQAALVSMDPHTGGVKALVGGYDFRRSRFDRAIQAHRQIGSGIKPFIYGTALAKGMTHLDIVPDAPITVRTAGGLWSPQNYEGDFRGPITLRTALAHSVNTVSVRLVLRVGVDPIIATMRKLGIRSPIPRHVSIALGTPDLTLLEVVSAYSALANGGKRVQAQDDLAGTPPGRFVDRVTTEDGTVVEDFSDRIPKKQVISPELAYLIVTLMKCVVQRGTGRRAQELGRPAAGKTGTSTEWRDAWFNGYTPDLVTGVWVGRDDFTPIGAHATGASAALPIWLQFMKAAHPDTPVRDFPVPPDITFVRADELTGQPLPPGAPNAVWVPFMRGTIPPRFARTVKPERFEAADDFSSTGKQPRRRP